MDLRALRIDVADQFLADHLHLERVHAEDQRRKFMDRGFHRAAEIIERAFADAVNAFIGGNARKKPVLPGITGDIMCR